MRSPSPECGRPPRSDAPAQLRRAARRNRGNVAILSALMLTMLLGFAALAVDLSNKYRVRAESQRAVDGAALSGARELDGTEAGMVSADAQARVVGEQHYAYASDISMSQGDIELGNWNLATRTFTTPALPADTNAVRVTYTEPEVAHPFAAPLTGTASSPVGASAIALGGGPSTVACGFPLALGSCTLQPQGGGTNCGGCLQLASAPDDNAGWSNFDGNTSNPAIAEAVLAACYQDGEPALDAAGNCANTCGAGQVGDDMNVGNGNNFTPNPNHFCELIKGLLVASPTGTFRAQVPVFHEDSSPCNPQFTGTKQAAGFAEVEFLGVSCGNNDDTRIEPPESSSCSAPAGHYIVARIQCNVRADAPAGGGFFGLSARPVLVD